MALTLKTPGVYVDEISTIPPAVAGVATAIPAFIGYTQIAPTPNIPTRITSLLEFEQNFGTSDPETYTVTLSDPPAALIGASAPTSKYNLHYNLQMYFANGGGPCYIISVGLHSLGTVSSSLLSDGIDLAAKVDEVTLLVVPEAVVTTDVTPAQRADLNSSMLDQCAKLKDRFSIIDTLTETSTIQGDADNFRSNEVGSNNLKYGAAYYPALNTTLIRFYNDSAVSITDNRGGAGAGPYHLKKLSNIHDGISATGTIAIGTVVLTETVTVNGIQFEIVTSPVNVDNTVTPYQFAAGANSSEAAANLKNAINGHAIASLYVTAAITSPLTTVRLTAKVAGTIPNTYTLAETGTTFTISGSTLSGGLNADKSLYNSISSVLQTNTLTLYPSSTMAGIYASVDRDRGVWKAPANVSLNRVVSPSVAVTAADQENLNVDPTSGKSINVIRTFTGKGNLVWGARTLAGNDNEWRYINVRRLFIYAEESIQKASEGVVFEANDANTWTRMKITIGSFLTNLWRDGALAGAKPDQAFFVKVGLGETMTTDDILNGIMNIEIGMAAVRPAEFIVLKFSHKLQEA